jgi:cellulose synthase/poly-beta-1,6-N-acetylglucosamine synthase-like glycosyltransferase
MIAEYLFWVPVLLLAHSYLLYPLLLKWIAGSTRLERRDTVEEELPFVSVIMAAYNEEKVIGAKIENIFNSDYPADKLELVVGSDGSTDETDSIIQSFIDKGYAIQFRSFGGRTGKSGILNQIFTSASGSILIPTDANILFELAMVRNLVSHFQDEKIALVSANILNTGMREDGISYQEEAYIKRENRIKYHEGLIWGNMMGAFGACYAIRAALFPKIPANFMMEDFYITMSVIDKGFKCICDLDAVAVEDVSNQWEEEFKRKIRISTGNFQNLSVFGRMLWPLWKPVGFAFFSHKFIRWVGPFLLMLAFAGNILLIGENLFYNLALCCQVLLWGSPLIDSLLKRLNIHNFAIRLGSYFISMNVALFIGWLRYRKGVQTSAWDPTARNID